MATTHLNALTVDQVNALHSGLKKLLETVLADKQVPSPDCGICLNWGELVPDDPNGITTYTVVQLLAPDWPGYDEDYADPCYPIPHPIGTFTGLWAGEQRDHRISLMRYMLKRLRDLRRRAPLTNEVPTQL